MPYSRYDWHVHLREVWGEHSSAREAVDRLKATVSQSPDLLSADSPARQHLSDADQNLEGTYIVRLFAAFEAALRSYDRAVHQDPVRQTDAATMIDQLGGKRHRGIQHEIRQKAHRVRLVRNYRAHESDDDPGEMSIHDALRFLNRFLAQFPDRW